MPVTLSPVSRRQFLASTAVAGVSAIGLRADAAESTDPDRFALLADTHIPGNVKVKNRGANMYENLASVSKQLAAIDRKKPARVIITGDCAYLAGLEEDYVNLLKLIEPVRKAGMPVHLLLGNHDHRENVMAAVPAAEQKTAVDEKHAAMMPSPRANWFLLDSLEHVNRTPGRLGEKQLTWLAKTLDAHRQKPAIIGVHHNPFEHKLALQDHDALFEVLAPRKQVKACFFGHTHTWKLQTREGIHLINLPPVAYVFSQGMPNGWVDAQLVDDGMTLRLVCHDTKHNKHGEVKQLAWRT